MKNKSCWHILVLISCCCMSLCTLGLVMNCVGVFYSPMAAELGVGRGSVAMFATICTLMNGFIAPFFRRAIKRFPVNAVLSTAIIVTVLSTLGISRATALWQLYLLGALQGASLSFFSSVPVNMLISNWFEKNHGLATGIAMCFSGVGGAVFSPIFTAAISAFGWRNAYVLLAVLLAVIALPGALFIVRLTPAERGLLPFGAQQAPKAAAAPQQTANAAPVAAAISLPFVLLTITGIFAAFNTGISQHLPGFAETIGLGAATGATMVSACMLGNLSSKLFIGILSDWLKPLRACLVMLGACLVGVIALLLFGSRSLVIALGASYLVGYVYSVASVGMPLVTKYVFGLDQFAVMYPRITVMVSLGSALALTIIGFIYDFTRSYAAAFLCCAAFLIISGAMLVILSLRRKEK